MNKRMPQFMARSVRRGLLGLAAPLALLILVLAPACNVNWPEPEELQEASDAAITTYDGVKRMAEIVARLKAFQEAQDNATLNEEEDLQ